MPITGANVNWDESVPADGDSLAQGDDVIRSTKSAIRTGLAAEHNWLATGGAGTGYHLKGAGRAFYGVQSAVSASGAALFADGRIMHASDTSRLFGVESLGTVFFGGATVISLGTFPGTAPQRHIWVEEIGAEACPASAIITFPNSGFSGKPYVYLSAESEAGITGVPTITALTATGFTAIASRCTVHYRSLGTRVL